MTYREAKEAAARMLAAAGVGNEAAESLFLMEASCGVDRSFYLLHEPEQMEAEREAAFFSLVEKRCARIPLQHLTGEQGFMGLPFFVSRDVLIPRQDTEILTEEALRVIGVGTRVLDLCTGSGCIAVSIKCLRPQAKVAGCDLSASALAVARRNAERNRAAVDLVESDLFSAIEGTFDVIVSNPPYIPGGEIAGLMPEVRDHEPRLALDGGEDGLYFYRRIAAEAGAYLRPGGYLLFEIGCGQGGEVSALMERSGFCGIEVIPDLAGLDRVVKGRKKKDV